MTEERAIRIGQAAQPFVIFALTVVMALLGFFATRATSNFEAKLDNQDGKLDIQSEKLSTMAAGFAGLQRDVAALLERDNPSRREFAAALARIAQLERRYDKLWDMMLTAKEKR